MLWWWRVVCLAAACMRAAAQCGDHAFTLDTRTCRACDTDFTRDTSLVAWLRFENASRSNHDTVTGGVAGTLALDDIPDPLSIVSDGILGTSLQMPQDNFQKYLYFDYTCTDCGGSWTITFMSAMSVELDGMYSSLGLEVVALYDATDTAILSVAYKLTDTAENALVVLRWPIGTEIYKSPPIGDDDSLTVLSYDHVSAQLVVRHGNLSASHTVPDINGPPGNVTLRFTSYSVYPVQLDDLRVYSRVLSDTEIADIAGQITTQRELFPCVACTRDSASLACSCAVGEYRGNTTCIACAAGKTSASGSTSPADCLCPAGFYQPDGASTCTACPEATYKSVAGNDAGLCAACPQGQTAPRGSRSSISCVCLPGSYTPDAGTACTLCHGGTYKPVPGNDAALCSACPAGLLSPGGSTAETDCACPADFYQARRGDACTPCPSDDANTSTDAAECLLGEYPQSVVGSSTALGVLKYTAHPGDPEVVVNHTFWLRAPCALPQLELRNVKQNLLNTWYGTGAGHFNLRLAFYNASSVILNQLLRWRGVLESRLVLPEGTDLDPYHVQFFSETESAALPVLAHLERFRDNRCWDPRPLCDALFARVHAILTAREPWDTIRIDVSIDVPERGSDWDTAMTHTVLEWSNITTVRNGACAVCPLHTVFVPADPGTGAPSLCAPCGSNAVFFPGSTRDAAGASVAELQREPRRRSCGEVQGNTTHLWCNPYQGRDAHVASRYPYPAPWLFQDPTSERSWPETESEQDAFEAWNEQHSLDARWDLWPNEAVFATNSGEYITDFHLLSIGEYDLSLVRLENDSVVFVPVTLRNRRRDARVISFNADPIYWTFTNNTDKNNPFMGELRFRDRPVVDASDGVATWKNGLLIVAGGRDSPLQMTRYTVRLLSSNKTDVDCLPNTTNGGRPPMWEGIRTFWVNDYNEYLCINITSPDLCKTIGSYSTQTRSICSYRLCGYECHDVCVRDVQSPQCNFTYETDIGFTNVSMRKYAVAPVSDAFALAALLHDGVALAARMTPHMLEVIANTTTGDARASVVLAPGPVCPPQMAWENGTAGTFMLALPCRGLTWHGHSQQQGPPRLGLLRARTTCEACPPGTFRGEAHPTCQPRFADAGACADTDADVGLGLDTSDANRPVARWNSTYVENIQAVLADVPDSVGSNCSCAPGSVVRYVPILGLAENNTAPGDTCAHPTRFLACAQRQRASTLAFWEPVLTYASPTAGNITRVRMCVPASRAGPDPETDDFAAYPDTPGFRGVRPAAVPAWSTDVVRATPLVRPGGAAGLDEVYVPRAVFPRHRGLLVEACPAETVAVAIPAGPAGAAVYAPGVFLHVGVFASAHDMLACQEACRASWECLWFSYAEMHNSTQCALGVGVAPSVALPPAHACGGDPACLLDNVFLPFVFKVDASAAVYVWEPTVSLAEHTPAGTVCVFGGRTCPRGSVRKPDTHGLCEECGRDRRRSIDLPYTCEVCPAETPARTPYTPECQKCTPAQFIDLTTGACRPCAVNHERDATQKSVCIPCALGEHRAPGDAECRACPPGYGGHYDRDALGCVRCSGSAGARCPCPAGWATDTSGAGGCTPCPPGTAKPDAGHGACVPCRAGLVAPQHGAVACVPCARDRGPGVTTRQDCLPVPAHNATPAMRADTCPAGYEAVPLYTTCMPCGRGWSKNTTGPGPCLPCPVQIRDAVYNATHCASAPDCAVAWGEVRDAAPLAMLHPDIAPRAGALPVCPEHDTSTVDPSTCECRAGHWRADASTCTPCAPGTFQPTTGDAGMCVACPRGFFQPAVGRDVCIPCPAGTYDPNPDPAAHRSTQGVTCQPCPANAISTMVAAHACVCMPGYTDHANSGVCLLCADNTFQPYLQSGMACTPCPEGTSGTPRDVRHVCVHCGQNQHWDDTLDRCECNAGYEREQGESSGDDDDGSSTLCVWRTGNEVCGDGFVLGAERDDVDFCDDGNTEPGDGCSPTCTVECGYVCGGGTAETPDACVDVCGDGVKTAAEACDDGNTAGGDGCSATCTEEFGFVCDESGPCAASVCASLCDASFTLTADASVCEKITILTATANVTFESDAICDVLVVAGGGGGGKSGKESNEYSDGGAGGGGGAGGVITLSRHAISPGTYPIWVGAGGSGQTQIKTQGESGGHSVAFGFTAIGGGGGGGNATGKSGGSGGGGGAPHGGGGAKGGSGTAEQGRDGGSASQTYSIAGGGGGYSTVGTSAVGQSGPWGHGGAGLATDISGEHKLYAGGGGGGSVGVSSSNGKSGGGSGGGGRDGMQNGGNAIAGTGSGGGGASKNGNGGNGASGIVIVRELRPTTRNPTLEITDESMPTFGPDHTGLLR